MASRNVAAVFISYARKDAEKLAQRLHSDLTKAGIDAWLDTREIAAGATWTVEIEQALDGRDVMLALLTPGSYVSEICRAEQLRALRKHKHVIPLLAKENSDIPLHLEAKNYRDFTGAKPYAAQFRTLLEDIRTRKNGVALLDVFRKTYVTAPPLPLNYVQRPDALASLRNVLITHGNGPSIALTALEGMGGIGKTVLAQALCHDEIVQQAFPDGVVWVTVGKEATYDLVTRMREVRRALHDIPAGQETELECINRYRTAMRDKAALVVVDDIWRASDLEPFRADSPRSRLLFTTRDASIAAAMGADEHTAGLLSEEQSRNVLARWSGMEAGDLPTEAAALIRECGRLPLALGVIGALLRGKPREYWKLVEKRLRADPGTIETEVPGYPHADLLRPIRISVDALDPQARSRYLSLAILLEDTRIDSAIQQTLWNTNESGALETAELFVSLSLAQREGNQGAIRLHDLQADYVRTQYPDREALNLIHDALRLSSHVIEKDPRQFASQLTGRLLPHDAKPAIQRFTASLARAARRPWIRALKPTLDPPGTGLLRTLTGHSSKVSGVALTPDGRWAVSASWDETLKVWDLETGRELRTIKGDSGFVNGVTVCPDGRRAISAGIDDTLRVWDLETGLEIRTLKGHSHFVQAVAVTLDGTIVSGSTDKTVRIWELETGRELHTLKGHSDIVFDVAVSPDGKTAVSASSDNTLRVWDLETGRALHTLKGHLSSVLGVAIGPDGRWAVSASQDNTLKVWDLKTGRELRTLKGHSSMVSSVAITPDGARAISGAWDNTLKVWDLETGRELRTLEGHSSYVFGVAISPDGHRVVSASHDCTLKVWDVETGQEFRDQQGHSSLVSAIAVTADGSRVVSGSWDFTMKVWEAQTGRELRTMKGYGAVSSLSIRHDGRRALTNLMELWSLASGRKLRTLNRDYKIHINAVALTANGQRAISGSDDKKLRIWDLETLGELRSMRGHSGSILGLALSPDDRRAVSASQDNTLIVWDLEKGRKIHKLEGHSHWVFDVAICPDGKRAVSASVDKTLKVWDLETGREIHTLVGHSEQVNCVGVSPDGRMAVSACDDHSITVWDLESAAAITTFICDAAVKCCAFASDRIIVAGDAAGRVHFLSLEL